MAMADWQRYPSKLCQIKFELYINVYEFVNLLFHLWFLYKVTCLFLLQEDVKKFLESQILNLEKR